MSKQVAILLCTYNGALFLREQIDSIIGQNHSNWILYISDDGSTDVTLKIIKEYQVKLGEDKLKIISGPRKGFAWNFLNLLYLCNDSDYYAFCDQDDVWKSDKLEKAIRVLDSFPRKIPNLYCGRTILIDENNQEIGYSPLFTKKPGFNNALIQNIAGGNTMVFNHAAKQILVKTPKWEKLPYHDWWTYLLISGVGGNLYYDPMPYVYYRQHAKNVIGINQGLRAKLVLFNNVWGGCYREEVSQNIYLLAQYSLSLSASNLKTFKKFVKIRRSNILVRLLLIFRLGVYRQTLWHTSLFYIMLILKKI